MSVGMWRADGNPNPCMDLYKICMHIPHLSKKGFGEVLTPTPSLPGRPETL